MSFLYRTVKPTSISSSCRAKLVLKMIRCCRNAGCKYILARSYNYIYVLTLFGGGTVVKVLSYKSEGRWFDPSLCHWNFSLI